MVKILDATTQHIPIIQDLAERTWRTTYAELLSKDQLEFMLRTIYSFESLASVMENGSQHFILLIENETYLGFAAYGTRPENPTINKLYKLYLLKETQGRGLGRILLDEVKERTQKSGVKTLELNVKRDNPAKAFYERCGFSVLKEENIPFGPYVLEDYVMRADL